MKKLKYVVCAQNRDDGEWGEPTHDQGQGFLIGKISGVEPSPEGREGRYIILFQEYADIDVPGMAYGWRNPVRYIELSDSGIDPDTLTWKPVHPPTEGKAPVSPVATGPARESGGLDIVEAKKALSTFYRVPVTAIEIVIRG